MMCLEIQARLPAYAHGALSGEEEAAFEAHVSTCAECAALVALAEPELRQTGTLPQSVVPVEDLWPAIQNRIGARTITGRISLPKWALAAAAVLLVAVSSAATVVLLQSPGRSAIGASTRLIGFEAEYTAASDDLTAALAAVRGRLAPETIATIERNLNIIDNALGESRRALATDPGNPALEQLVVAAWRQKMDLLRRATSIGGAS